MNFRCESGKRFDNKKVAYFYGDNVDKIIVFYHFQLLHIMNVSLSFAVLFIVQQI